MRRPFYISKKLSELPAPRAIPWQMRPLSSAETEVRWLADGRMRLGIRHEILRGITPSMLVWWFNNLQGAIDVAGVRHHSRYQIWHPVDHVAVRIVRRGPNGRVEPGAVIHITEAFAGRLDWLIDFHTLVEKLDEEGFRHRPHQLGLSLACMDYTFTPVDGGTLYQNSLTLGSEAPVVGRALNRFLLPRLMPEDRARAWLLHNIEEVGNLEHFLPELYRRRRESSQ